jgi:hypothetical protein
MEGLRLKVTRTWYFLNFYNQYKHHSGRTNFWGGSDTTATSLRHVSMYGTGCWQISLQQFM